MEQIGVIFDVLKTGSPWAVTSLVVVAWLLEKRERQEIQKSMFDFATNQATNQVISNNKVETSINALKDLINQLSNRF